MLTRAFGTEERGFVLKGRGWRDLEKARDAGLGLIAARLAPLVALKGAGVSGSEIMAALAGGHFGDARLDDVREPILQGLIDAGMTSTEAGALVRKVFDEEIGRGVSPMLAWCDLAFDIVTQALIGLEDEKPPPGETAAARAKSPPRRRSQTARPGSPTSTPASA